MGFWKTRLVLFATRHKASSLSKSVPPTDLNFHRCGLVCRELCNGVGKEMI